MRLVYDSNDETDGDVSELDLDQEAMEVEIGDGEKSEEESGPAVEIRVDSDNEDDKMEEAKDDDDEEDLYGASPRISLAVSGVLEIDDDATISDLNLGEGEEIDDDAAVDENNEDCYDSSPRRAPGLRLRPEFANLGLGAAALQQNYDLRHGNNRQPLPHIPSPTSVPYQPPTPPTRRSHSPPFNRRPAHFTRTYRGVTTHWSVAEWEERREEVETEEARLDAKLLRNRRRWRINGGRGRISRRRAWKKANGERKRGNNGRFE